MNICLKCNEEKNNTEFYTWKRRKNGLSPYCIECYREINRKYAKENKNKTLLRVQKFYKKFNKKERLKMWKENYLRNKQYYDEYYKNRTKQLQVNIIKKYLAPNGYKNIDIPLELIKAKKAQIILKRKIDLLTKN